MRACSYWIIGLLTAGLFLVPQATDARVLRVDIDRRTPVLDGKAFGEHGAYELIEGTIVFGVDPGNPQNQAIVDLARAPRDSAGLVRARANFVVLQPIEPENRRGVGLVEVSNRGGKFTLPYFNRATASLDPTDPEAFGDELLMEEGLTLIWVGWQWDVPREGDPLRLEVPVADGPNGEPIGGTVRSDWVVEEATRTLALGHRDHVAYAVADPGHPATVLTARDGRNAPRRVVPRDKWRFARETDDGSVVADSMHIYMEDGFEPGTIYEAVYWAEGPRVVGLGLAAIRDVMAYAKHDPDAVFPVENGIAAGVSQTGRFLRHYLYEGFNTDGAGRKVYDGLMIITAGAGRGSFNHRFAQPSRDAHRYSAFLYPTDIFPFTSRPQMDSTAWRSDGLLNRVPEAHRPKTFYVNTGYEYWGRAASLIHTSVDGRRDVPPRSNERIYHLASTQHFPWRFPPPEENKLRDEPPLYRGNPLDQSVNYRALLVRLLEWVDDGQTPPESRYPRHSDDTLVRPDALAFPAIPSVDAPEVIHEAYRVDYGPRWREIGILRRQPPRVGPAYPSLVSQVDSLGNEQAGVKNVGVRVPLATYLPWNLRLDARTNRNELTDFFGSIVPLPRTQAQKIRTGDPRPAVSSLYEDREDYLDQSAEAADRLIEQGFLLPADRERVLDRAEARWDWVHSLSGASSEDD